MLGNKSSKSSKRQKHLNSEPSCKPRKQERRDGRNISFTEDVPCNSENMEVSASSEDIPSQNASDHQESMDISQSDDASTSREDYIQQLSKVAENIIEVEVDFNEKIGKNGVNLDKTGIPEVLNAELALRNTNGGIIKLKMKTQLSPENKIKKIDQWELNLNEKREKRLKTLGQKENLAEIIDFNSEDLLLYVNKSSIILTDNSYLFVRNGPQKKELQSYLEIQNLLVNDKTRCCCTNGRTMKSFIQGQEMPFGESTTVEYKQLTSKNLPDKLRDVLGEYIVQFANTRGGYVYFGITDAAIIKGQQVNEEELHAIEHKVQCCMETKFWINKSGEKKIPERGNHYEVTFFPVNEADERTFVIQVHICRYAGTVFLKEPECKAVDDNNQIVNMGFERWLASFLKSVKTVKGNSVYQDRFEERKRGTSTYYSVKDTVEKFVAGVTSASPGQLKLHPTHAVDWIQDPALCKFIDTTKEIFQDKQWQSGIAYIERCWEINLGLPSTKPDDVICDVLLCCPQMPLVFVSLTQSDIPSEASSSYNRKVAAKLKATLAQDADCLEKFYVKPVVNSHKQLEVLEDASWIFSETPLYPETYRMNNDKYQKVLEALVLVLARANVMASHVVGQGIFNLLTFEQYNVLHEFYEESPKVKITGPPGSGKTVLALERIHRLRNNGCCYYEVLFLCSNLPLKARVENMRTLDRQRLCIVMTYYEIDCLVQSDVRFNIELGNVKHILADEAQNFHDKKGDPLDTLAGWSKLHALCDNREDSSFWVFFDLAQKINNKRSVNLWRFPKKELKTVIRQTGNVHRFITSKYMRVDPQVKLGHDFDGPGIDVLVPNRTNANCSMQSHLTYILISELHKLIIKDGHHLNDITVLFNDRKQKELYEKLFLQMTKDSCPVRNGEEVLGHGVVFDTIRRYCGVDDNIVIGFSPKYYKSGFQNNRSLMTALCSRTKMKLILILENKEEAKLFDLAPTELTFVRFGNVREVSNFSRQ